MPIFHIKHHRKPWNSHKGKGQEIMYLQCQIFFQRCHISSLLAKWALSIQKIPKHFKGFRNCTTERSFHQELKSSYWNRIYSNTSWQIGGLLGELETLRIAFRQDLDFAQMVNTNTLTLHFSIISDCNKHPKPVQHKTPRGAPKDQRYWWDTV